MKLTKWILNDVIYKNTSYGNLPEIIQDLGMAVKIVDNKSLLTNFELPFPKDDCVIPYASLNVIRKLNFYFGTYCTEENLKYSTYFSLFNIPKNNFVNENPIFITFNILKTNPHFYFNLLETDKLFIKPNSGMKLFTGYVVDIRDVEKEIIYLNSTALSDDSLIMISKEVEIENEARFVICNGDIIDGSTYSIEDDIPNDRSIINNYIPFVKENITGHWFPDPVFTMDIGAVNGTPKIIELNSFSGAGLYNMDIEKIITEVSNFTEEGYREVYL